MSVLTKLPANCINTYSGRQVDVFDPDPADIVIGDIAHALSHQCRWGGHTKEFYSVAHHSLLVALKVPDELKLAALLHDASEAYLVDLPRPIKANLPGYVAAENHLMHVIAKKFGFEWPMHPDIAKADDDILHLEYRTHMVGKWESPIKLIRQVKGLFLSRYAKYRQL